MEERKRKLHKKRTEGMAAFDNRKGTGILEKRKTKKVYSYSDLKNTEIQFYTLRLYRKPLNKALLKALLFTKGDRVNEKTGIPLSLCSASSRKSLMKSPKNGLQLNTAQTAQRKEHQRTQPEDHLVHIKGIFHISIHQAWRVHKRHQAEPFLSRRADFCAQVLGNTLRRIQKRLEGFQNQYSHEKRFKYIINK